MIWGKSKNVSNLCKDRAQEGNNSPTLLVLAPLYGVTSIGTISFDHFYNPLQEYTWIFLFKLACLAAPTLSSTNVWDKI